jgi:hypothetical protein
MIVLVVLSILLQCYVCLKLYKTNEIHGLLAISAIFYSMIWIVIPGIISFSIYFSILESKFPSNFISNEYIILYSLESLFFATVLVASRYLLTKQPHKKILQVDTQLSSRLLVIALLTFSFIIGIKYFLGANIEYLERNDVTLYDDKRVFVILYIVYELLKSVIIYGAIVFNSSRIITTLIWISLLVVASLDTISGSRISVLLPIFVFFCKIHYRSKSLWKLIFSAVIILVLAFAFLMPIAVTISKYRGEGIIGKDIIESNRGVNISLGEMADELFSKFNSFSSGLYLIEGYGPGDAGIRPYIGSALVFLPRFIFPDRPVASSVDGTIYGTPSRLVPQLFMDSKSKNVGVSPLAISVWQFDWFFGGGVLLIAGILNFLLLQYLLTRNNFAYKIIAIYTIKIPTFNGVFHSPDVLLKNAVEIVCMSIVLAIVIKIFFQFSLQKRFSLTRIFDGFVKSPF